MAYRGGVGKNQISNKKTFPTSNSNQSGFESQFSDLAYSACPPSSKRPRTSTGGKQNFNSAAKNKTPLKFDFKSTKINDNKIIPVAAPSVSTSNQRYISKPVLASQAVHAQLQQDLVTDVGDDDWADDDEDDLLCVALSQVDPSPGDNPSNIAATDQDLWDIASQLEDDDDVFDDATLAGIDANVAAHEEDKEDRLNQTVTNFPATQAAPSCQVFKQPPPPQAPRAPHNESVKMKEDHERLKRLQMKAQGEVSFLRIKLGEQSKEIENERIGKRKLEAELKLKLETEKKAKESELNSIKTEKQFLVQEMLQLKERLKQVEVEAKKAETGGTPRSRKVLSQIKVDKNEFPTLMEFKEKKIKTEVVDCETQTNELKKRKCRLKRSTGKGIVMAQSFCRLSTVPSQVQAKILLQNTKAGVMREVGRTVMQVTGNINSSLPTTPSPSYLANLTTLFSTCGSIITTEERTAVTETCSNILSLIIKSSDCTLLAPTLSLLKAAWSPSLLDQDITAYILSLLSEIIRSVKTLSAELSPAFIEPLFSLLVLVSRDPVQTVLLCKQSQDCFLSCISMLLYMCLLKTQEAQLAACKGLVKWLLHCSVFSHTVAWMDNTCKWCTGDIVRTVTLTTQSQVRWQVDHMAREEEMDKELLKDCVTAMARLQDNVRIDSGEETEWIKMVEVSASVQRKYIWAVEHLIKMELGQETAVKLADLRMETDMGPEDKLEQMEIDKPFLN